MKNWVETLPREIWRSLVDDQGKVLCTFKLVDYKIQNGSPSMTMAMKLGYQVTGGIEDIIVHPKLSIRFYMPIQLSRVNGHPELSPKVVYILPKNYRIEKQENLIPTAEQVTEAVRKHSIINFS
jgi:hypothetical protein